MNFESLSKQADRGVKAQTLLENELLNKWWDSAEKNLFEQWKTTNPSDKERLVYLKALIDAQQAMRADFCRYVSEGKQARAKLGNETKVEKIKSTIKRVI